MLHFKLHLQQPAVEFGQDAFALLDVRRQARLGFECNTTLSKFVFNGGADAVVVPYGELDWQLQTRVVVDWQTPKSFWNLDGVKLQQQLELMGAIRHSNHPTIVVFTDLS